MNGYMFAGIMVGLVIAAALLKFAKKNKAIGFTYDERQAAKRGVAYKYAFYTLMVYNVTYGILDMSLPSPWAEDLTGLMIGVCLAILVHIIYSIWNECYFSMNEEPKRVVFLFVVITVVNAIVAVGQGMRGELIENGMLTNNCANLVVAIMFGIIFIMLMLKWQQKKREVEED